MERRGRSGQILVEFMFFCIFALIVLTALKMMTLQAQENFKNSRFKVQEARPQNLKVMGSY